MNCLIMQVLEASDTTQVIFLGYSQKTRQWASLLTTLYMLVIYRKIKLELIQKPPFPGVKLLSCQEVGQVCWSREEKKAQWANLSVISAS